MAEVRRTIQRHTIGMDCLQFQKDIIDAISRGIVEDMPETSNLFEGPDPHRTIHMLVNSQQGLQRGEEQGEYEPIIFLQFVEGFKNGMVVIAWAIITTKGVMADSLDDQLFEIITASIKKVGEESEDITVSGAVIKDGNPMSSEEFLSGAQGGGFSHVASQLMDLLRGNPGDKKEDGK